METKKLVKVLQKPLHMQKVKSLDGTQTLIFSLIKENDRIKDFMKF